MGGAINIMYSHYKAWDGEEIQRETKGSDQASYSESTEKRVRSMISGTVVDLLIELRLQRQSPI